MEKNDVDAYINGLISLLNVTQTYAQISSRHVMNIRGSVVMNRDFTSSVYEIFQEVVSSYSQEVALLAKKNRGKNNELITFLPHNGKTVFVFLSANTGLFGDIINKTFRYMMKDLKQSGAEVTVVGRLGRTMFQVGAPNQPYSYFDYPDYGTSQEEFMKLISHLVQYEEIHVYYSQFQSMVNQEPVKFKIDAQTPMSVSIHKGDQKHFIFEPNLSSILKFFESEIFTSVIDQVLQESQLAKSASRILAMNRATKNIEEELKKSKIRQNREKHGKENKRLINSMIPRIALSL